MPSFRIKIFACIAVLSFLIPPATLPARAITRQVRVRLETQISTKTARTGQRVRAKLAQDYRKADHLIAPRGSLVVGQVAGIYKARRLIHAEVSPKRWLKSSGGVSLIFNEIVTPAGKHVRITGIPVAVLGQTEKLPRGRQAMVASRGTVENSAKSDLSSKAARVAIQGAALLGIVVAPIVGGVAGAVKPDLVLPKAADQQGAKHRRLKGLATGVVAGIPGGFLVTDSVLRGREVTLRPGTEILLELSSSK